MEDYIQVTNSITHATQVVYYTQAHYISRLIVPIGDIQIATFHPTMHYNSKFIVMHGVQVYLHLNS